MKKDTAEARMERVAFKGCMGALAFVVGAMFGFYWVLYGLGCIVGGC